MIFQNEATIGGRVTKMSRNTERKIARIWVEVPQGDADSDRDAGKTVTIPVDVTDDAQFAKTEVIKEGDFFMCKAQLVNRKMKADDKDTKYTIRWPEALASRELIIIPGGGKYAPAAFNDIVVQGRAQRIGDLRESGTRKMVFVTVTYMPKMDKNASDDEKKEATVYVDAAFFGGTAEKYIKPYLKEKDVILLKGNLVMYEEKWTSGGKKVQSVRLAARDANFVTPVEKDGRKRQSDAPNYDKTRDIGNDDDLPF